MQDTTSQNWAEIEAPLIAQGERDAAAAREHIDADETAARAATAGEWDYGRSVYRTIYAGRIPGVEKSGTLIGVMDKPADSAHVARWNPQRVLSLCDTLRDVLTGLERIAERGDPDSRAWARAGINNLRRIGEPDQ